MPLTETGPGAVEAMGAQFRAEGLPPPPVPDRFVPSFRRQGEWRFGTRTGVPDLYTLAWFLDELRAGEAPEYVLIGHDGHGVNSWAMHFYLVQQPLAIFLQLAWGGVYMDNVEAGERVAQRFAEADRLVEAASKGLSTETSLLVVESDLQQSGWRRFGEAWQPSADPLADCLSHLDG
ncbi:MAG: hypothetical protein JO023_26030 [Chloroflexi bacterium]|nr:hypothetical protein [Chloroflexota bacterium]